MKITITGLWFSNNMELNDLRIIICLKNFRLLLKEFQFVMTLKFD